MKQNRMMMTYSMVWFDNGIVGHLVIIQHINIDMYYLLSLSFIKVH